MRRAAHARRPASARDARTPTASRRSAAGAQAIDVGQKAVTPYRGSRPAITAIAPAAVERVGAFDAVDVDVDESGDDAAGRRSPRPGCRATGARARHDLGDAAVVEDERALLEHAIGQHDDAPESTIRARSRTAPARSSGTADVPLELAAFERQRRRAVGAEQLAIHASHQPAQPALVGRGEHDHPGALARREPPIVE